MTMRRFNFLGVPISAANLTDALDVLTSVTSDKPQYVCFPDSFVIRAAGRDARLNRILSESLMTLPDGKPSQWFANCIGLKTVKTVSGYDVCMKLLDTQHSHFFYGGSGQQLQAMAMQLKEQFPKAHIIGMKSPPMVRADEISKNAAIVADLRAINALSPDFIWIGISSPKQDFLMDHARSVLSRGTLLGIGGVFNYIANPQSKSPEWMKRFGLRWLYRAVREPRRLAGKYLGMLLFIISRLPRLIYDIIRQRRGANS